MIYYRNGLQVGATSNMNSFNRILKYFPETKKINKLTAYVLGTISIIIYFLLLVVALPIGCVAIVFFMLFKLFELVTKKLLNIMDHFMPINTIF